jgi:addiction module HigA family antidote
MGSMTKKLPKRGLPPMHPGEFLREEILPALDRPKTEIAKLLGVSRQTLYDIIEEKQPVTPLMAHRDRAASQQGRRRRRPDSLLRRAEKLKKSKLTGKPP